MAVLKAYKFDNDHLYQLRYKDLSGKTRCYHHSYTDEGPYAHDIAVGEAGLPEKEVMHFWFDFGDDWRFLLRLERIAPADDTLEEPALLEFTGTPPEQYPMDPE